jgi:hypothetical protein
MAQNTTPPVTTQTVEAARGKWEDNLKHVWGGMGGVVHSGAKYMQDAALGLTAIPIVGEALAAVDVPVYALATAFRGAVRTSAENHAIEAAGGTEEHKGGTSRLLGNVVKSAIPMFDV